jgi:hypothetical protein
MNLTKNNFSSVMQALDYEFLSFSKEVKTEKWQGRSTQNRPDLTTREIINATIRVNLCQRTDLDWYKHDIQPHLPWADDHFAERVGGEPLNPGNTWHTWRHAASASSFIEGQKRQFNHTYMERFWPKYAGKVFPADYSETLAKSVGFGINRGIRWNFGDLSDLITLLIKEPHTRQAYIPLFFPEDTGVADGGRKPCTLGYQFLLRDNKLHIYYPMRSCDYANHFADDCYLAVRLLLWVIEQCRTPQSVADKHAAIVSDSVNVWDHVVPGTFTMHCTSLHMFANDFIALKKRYE